jgi:tetratricopeptide (TPR) repeat protein
VRSDRLESFVRIHYRLGCERQSQSETHEALYHYGQAVLGGLLLDGLHDRRGDPPAERVWAHLVRGRLRHGLGQYAGAIGDYEEAIRLSAGMTWALDALAWLLATCPVDEHRDGRRAVALARRACKRCGWRPYQMLDTLAAAHAETGRFSLAVDWQTRALDAAPRNEYEHYLRRLRLYKSQRPCRAPRGGKLNQED